MAKSGTSCVPLRSDMAGWAIRKDNGVMEDGNERARRGGLCSQ